MQTDRLWQYHWYDDFFRVNMRQGSVWHYAAVYAEVLWLKWNNYCLQGSVWHRAAVYTEMFRPGAGSQADRTAHGETRGGGDWVQHAAEPAAPTPRAGVWFVRDRQRQHHHHAAVSQSLPSKGLCTVESLMAEHLMKDHLSFKITFCGTFPFVLPCSQPLTEDHPLSLTHFGPCLPVPLCTTGPHPPHRSHLKNG